MEIDAFGDIKNSIINYLSLFLIFGVVMSTEIDGSNISLDELCQQRLGVRRSEYLSSLSEGKQMMWEQVLLLMLYARSRYTTGQRQSVSHFHARISLLRLAARQDGNMLLTLTTRWLDQGKGLVAIVEELNQIQQAKPELKASIQRFIRECEQEQIVFSAVAPGSELLYSHYAIYVALVQPVSLFQQLLSEETPERIFDQLLRNFLQERVWMPTTRVTAEGQLELETAQPSLETLLQHFTRNGEDTVHFGKAVERYQAEVMEKLFSRFSCPETSANYHLSSQSELIEKLCVVSQNSNESVQLTLGRKRVESFLLMGQSDEIVQALSECLKVNLGKRLNIKRQGAAVAGSVALGKWYRHVTSGLLRGRSQIPALVAAIMDFDIRHAEYGMHGLHHSIPWPFKDKLSSADATLLTTRIIAHCLTCNGDPRDFDRPSLMRVTPSEYQPDEAATPFPLADNLMKAWATEDGKNEKDRIKRPRQRLTAQLQQAESDIRAQQGRAMDQRYPVNAGFPPPLWATCLQ